MCLEQQTQPDNADVLVRTHYAETAYAKARQPQATASVDVADMQETQIIQIGTMKFSELTAESLGRMQSYKPIGTKNSTLVDFDSDKGHSEIILGNYSMQSYLA